MPTFRMTIDLDATEDVLVTAFAQAKDAAFDVFRAAKLEPKLRSLEFVQPGVRSVAAHAAALMLAAIEGYERSLQAAGLPKESIDQLVAKLATTSAIEKLTDRLQSLKENGT